MRAMLRITSDTTVSVLALELLKLGAQYWFSRLTSDPLRPFTVVVGRAGLECSDTGATYEEALDGAVARFIHRVADRDLAHRFTKED